MRLREPKIPISQKVANIAYNCLIDAIQGKSIDKYQAELQEEKHNPPRLFFEKKLRSSVAARTLTGVKQYTNNNKSRKVDLFDINGVPTHISWSSENKNGPYQVDFDSYLGMSPYHSDPDHIPAPPEFKQLLKTYKNYIDAVSHASIPKKTLRQTIILGQPIKCFFKQSEQVITRIKDIGTLADKVRYDAKKIVHSEWLGFLLEDDLDFNKELNRHTYA